MDSTARRGQNVSQRASVGRVRYRVEARARVGTRQMKALLERVTAIAGLEQVLLSVTSTQIAALALYRSLGFELFGTEPRALNINGEFIDEHYLVFRLR